MKNSRTTPDTLVSILDCGPHSDSTACDALTCQQPAGGANMQVSELRLSNTWYDSRGRRTGVTDELGNQTTYTYDGMGRVTIETNEASQCRSYQYSAPGDLTRMRDRNGRVLQFGYDLLGQLTSEEWRSSADPVPSLTIVTTTQGGPANEVQRVGVRAREVVASVVIAG